MRRERDVLIIGEERAAEVEAQDEREVHVQRQFFGQRGLFEPCRVLHLRKHPFQRCALQLLRDGNGLRTARRVAVHVREVDAAHVEHHGVHVARELSGRGLVKLRADFQASEIQIWTDIDGMHNNDPRIVDKTSPVRHLHFEEAAELAYFGAKILHPTCIQPAKYANIPVRLLNTMDPTAPGTLISNDTEKGKIKAVAAKDNITAIKIKSSRMLLAHGFLRKVFEIFESYQTSIDMICTSEVGVSVSIDNTKHLNEILDDLKKYGTVTVDKDMCIICVVGDLEWENIGFEAKALDAMRDIPVRMISFGGSNYNISFLIRECDKKQALQSLSDALFNE